jgi:hypothetical protein
MQLAQGCWPDFGLLTETSVEHNKLEMLTALGCQRLRRHHTFGIKTKIAKGKAGQAEMTLSEVPPSAFVTDTISFWSVPPVPT